MRTLLSLFAFTMALAGADLNGIWIGQVPTRNGDLLDVAFKFTQEGTKLGGKLYGDYQSTAITEGKITGDDVSFIVVTQEQNGNQINETKLRFTGSLKNGELELVREREGSKNAGNAGGVETRNNAKQTLHLKRLW